MLAQSDIAQIAGRLRNLSRDGGAIEAAQVKVLGLDDIRVAAGDRWPRMRERVRTGSLSILSQHCGPEDVVVPAGDGFLVILAEDRAGEAQKRCQEMSDALLAFYLGEDALKTLRPDVQKRSLTADSLSELISGGLDSHPHDDFAPRANIAVAPIFVAGEKRLGAKLCASVVHDRRYKRIGYNAEYILDGMHPRDLDYCELDVAIVKDALSRMRAAKTAGKPCAMGLTVHATTLQQRKSREAWLAHLNTADVDERRHLFVIVAEIEKGAPFISIAEWCSLLRVHAARTWLEFHYSDHAIKSIGGAGAWAAGFQLPSFAASGNPRAPRMLEQAAFWSRTIHGQNMRLFTHGFQDKDFFAEAARAGIDFAMGDAIWPFEASAPTPAPRLAS